MLDGAFPEVLLVRGFETAHQGRTMSLRKVSRINAFRRRGFAGFAPRGRRWPPVGGARDTGQGEPVQLVTEIARREVAVRIGGEPGVLVAQDLLHRREARPAHEGLARQGVAGVVEPNLSSSPHGPEFHLTRWATASLGVRVPFGVPAPLAPALVVVVLDDAGPHHGGPQDELEVQVSRPHLALRVGEQERPRGFHPGAYVLDQLLVDRHGRAMATLGGVSLVRAADEERTPREVHVLFLQREDFPAPQTGEQPHGKHPAPVLGQGGEHRTDFVSGQDVVPALGHLARAGLLGGVLTRPDAVLDGRRKDDREGGADPIDGPRARGLAAHGDRLGELGEVFGELSTSDGTRLEVTEPGGPRRIGVGVARMLGDAIEVAGRAAQVLEMNPVSPVAELGKRAAEQGARLEPVMEPLLLLRDFERELGGLGLGFDAAQGNGFPRPVGLFDLGVPSDFTTGQRTRVHGRHQRFGIRITLPPAAGAARRSAYSRTRAGKYRITPPSFA